MTKEAEAVDVQTTVRLDVPDRLSESVFLVADDTVLHETGQSLAFDDLLLYSHMAMQSALRLDFTFHALADGTRRSMIHALANGEVRSAGELGRQFRSAQPTISKHLKVLEQAGLVERTIEGRVHQFRLRRERLQDAQKWIERHQAFWTGAVEQLDRLLSEIPGR